MSRYTLHARSGLLIAGLLLLPAALVAAEGEAAVPTVKIEPQLRARSHASEATIEAVRQATVDLVGALRGEGIQRLAEGN